MKKAKEIVKYLDLEFDSEINREYYNNIIIEAIKIVQIDAIEETVKLCAEKAQIEFIDKALDEVFDYTDVLVVDNVDVRINSKSILNCVEILKQQL